MTDKKKSIKKLTPMEVQYADAKQAFPDAILLMRVGDFFEIFGQDAVVASRSLGITLTSRDKNKEDAKPMCGVPHHAVDAYIARLLADGFRVAICDQIENPKDAVGVVKRAITRVYTPGVVLEEDTLAQTERRLLGAAVERNGMWGVAWIDFSTGEVQVYQIRDRDEALRWLARSDLFEWVGEEGEGGSWSVLADRFGASKVVKGKKFAASAEDLSKLFPFSARPQLHPALTSVASLDALLLAAGYITHIQLQRMPALRLPLEDPSVPLDTDTIRNLEIFTAGLEQRRSGSLFAVLDNTVTAAGRRQLADLLRQPLITAPAIQDRQDQVCWLSEHQEQQRALTEVLRKTADCQRIAVRALNRARVSGHDLAAMRDTLSAWPHMKQLLAESSAWQGYCNAVPDLAELAATLQATLVEQPAINPTKGSVITKEYDEYLYSYINMRENAGDVLAAYESRLKDQTGLQTLKVRYNRVFGYYIEIPRAYSGDVPESFVRKQTLANVERFATDELIALGDEILKATESALDRENVLFQELISILAGQAAGLIKLGQTLGFIDAAAAMAGKSVNQGWNFPELVEPDSGADILEGAHPALQASLRDKFVKNSTTFDERNRLQILTGPNMGGKSTYLKQIGQLYLLAQIGCPVPATRMSFAPVDQIFTRVGAGDDIAQGESTFMVEMRQCAHIVERATARSLVLLDEVGRGTSTFDGLSIAWSLVQYMQNEICCNTVFATHYHELADLAELVKGVSVYGMEVTEWEGDIVFLHRVRPGPTPHSYGIHVASLAGLPEALLIMARDKLRTLEHWEPGSVQASPETAVARQGPGTEQLSLFPTADEKLLQQIAGEEPLHLTPIQALEKLAVYQSQAATILKGHKP